jgi:hypothetical protein
MNKLAASFPPDWTLTKTHENGKGEIHVISKASRFLEGGLTGLAWIRMAAAGHQTILNNVQD